MTTGQALSTNTFGVAKWVVSADATQGTHTTIGAALTSASSGDTIYIRDGTYTENLTLKNGVDIWGEGINTTIVGKLTMTATGGAQYYNFNLSTNSDNIVSVTGSNVVALTFINCYLTCSNNNGIVLNNSGTNTAINLINCFISNGPNFAVFTVTNGIMLIQNCTWNDLSGLIVSNGVSSIAVGTLQIENCFIANGLSATGGTINIYNSTVDQGSKNVTAITNNGGTVNSYGCTYKAGSASGITVTSGTFNSYDDIVESSNTNAITGAGTINYVGTKFSGSSVKINTTTQTGGQVQGGVNGNAIAAGFVGQIISATIGSPGSALNASTVTNVTSITLTPGNWDISGVVGYHATTNATGNTGFGAWLSATTASQAPLDNMSSVGIAGAGVTPLSAGSGSDIVITAGPSRVSIAANTTYYLNANWSQTIATGVISAYGMIRAIRVG
jgi:hypothetical protein